MVWRMIPPSSKVIFSMVFPRFLFGLPASGKHLIDIAENRFGDVRFVHCVKVNSPDSVTGKVDNLRHRVLDAGLAQRLRLVPEPVDDHQQFARHIGVG